MLRKQAALLPAPCLFLSEVYAAIIGKVDITPIAETVTVGISLIRVGGTQAIIDVIGDPVVVGIVLRGAITNNGIALSPVSFANTSRKDRKFYPAGRVSLMRNQSILSMLRQVGADAIEQRSSPSGAAWSRGRSPQSRKRSMTRTEWFDMAPSYCIELTPDEQAQLLVIALGSIRHGLTPHRPQDINPPHLAGTLTQKHGSFVTLSQSGMLRGCIGTLRGHTASQSQSQPMRFMTVGSPRYQPQDWIKPGLPCDYWSASIQFYRYHTLSFAEHLAEPATPT